MQPSVNNQHVTYGIKQIIDANTLQLDNGKIIKLIGVDTRINPEAAKRFLTDLTKNKKIIIEFDETILDNKELAYVYVWGIDTKKITADIDKSSFEYHGFLDVKDNILGGTRKGLSLFLNATMIKAGLAKVDTKQEFKLKEQFLKLQEKAEQK